MPNFDKTGPNGDGPRTGRGRGVNRPQQDKRVKVPSRRLGRSKK